LEKKKTMTDGLKLDIDQLMRRLPHRYPFLLIDKVIDCRPGESLVAIKNVTINEPFFTGHFPGNPVMPGVLVIEALAQAGGVLAWETTESVRNALPYFAGIDKARFKRMVRPGDQLTLRVNLLARRQQLWRFGAVAEVDGALAAQAEILIVAGSKS
jgi:3-hydroxyacyl-[acyl-carrier-protein] dehydratase